MLNWIVRNRIVYLNRNEFDIINLKGKPLKLVDQFTYLGSNISSTESDVSIRIGKARTTFDRLLIIWKSDLSRWNNAHGFKYVLSFVCTQLYGFKWLMIILCKQLQIQTFIIKTNNLQSYDKKYSYTILILNRDLFDP